MSTNSGAVQCQGCAKRIYLPLTRPPAFAMPPAEKRPSGRASHHAPHGVRPAYFCRAGGLGNTPTSGKGYSFPLLAKVTKEKVLLE